MQENSKALTSKVPFVHSLCPSQLNI